MNRLAPRLLLVAMIVHPVATARVELAAQSIGLETFEEIPWRYIGPVGNRVTAVAGVVGDPLTYYVGSASGGIFKTADAGATWEPIFDGEPVASIGAIMVDPTDPNVVWAGTGESNIRSNISLGAGIYRSTDAGRNWTLMGLDRTGRIARIAVDPRDPDVVHVCALGRAYGPQQDRGVYRSTDGGESWERTLFVDEDTGCGDLAMDPNNPRILFAGMWQIEIHTWGRTSGGPGSGIFRSVDGGATWVRLSGNGLPDQEVGRIGLAIAPSRSERIYATIETGTGEPWKGEPTSPGTLWRSDDGGDLWRMVNTDHNVTGRPHYYSFVAVAPDDENTAYFLTASFSWSLDGGETLVTRRGYPATAGGHNLQTPPLGDFHDMWIDPADGNRMIVGNDGGAGISVNRGRTWERFQFPNAQIYHVTTDDRIPYNVYGNRQDGPSFMGPSNSLVFGYGRMAPTISRDLWRTVAGGESGWTIPDPVEPDIIWSSGTGSGSLGGSIDRFDLRTGQYRPVEVWPDRPGGTPAEGVKYRFNWTFPVAMSPHDHERIYVGSQYVHLTTDGGESWEVISPDLTLDDKSRQGFSGGLTGDNIGVEYAGALMTISESPLQAGVIWTGSNDGQVQVTRDGGQSWTNVTGNIPELPPWGTVYSIDPSPHDPAAAYIAVDFHQEDRYDPYVYKTSDYGRTWRNLSAGIPTGPLSYVHAIKEDPARAGLLYAGTEGGIHVSFDDGRTWSSLQNNLPHVPVYGITVQERLGDLVIATYGRGFWILDDLTPVREVTPEVLAAPAHLFSPRDAYRFRGTTPPSAPSYDPVAGFNPPYGANIDYHLGSDARQPVLVEILDADGRRVRTLRGSDRAGLHRLWWDLESDPTEDIVAHTSPIYAPHLRPGPEGRVVSGGLSLLEPPGTYTVRLTVDGQSHTRPLRLRKDPRSGGSEADIAEQMELLRTIRDDYVSVTRMINGAELIRKQLWDLVAVLAEAEHQPVRSAARELDGRFVDLEENLHQMRLTGGQDGMRWPAQLVTKLRHLFSQVGSSDFAPTRQQEEVRDLLAGEIRDLEARYRSLVGEDLAGFNAMLRQRNLANIIAGS